MRNNGEDRAEMLTASEVREITGVPVSTLHDWAAKREHGIDAPGPHHVRLKRPPPALDARRRERLARNGLRLIEVLALDARRRPARSSVRLFPGNVRPQGL